MNKEEILNKYIDLIDKGYCSDCNELNCIDNFPHAKITHAIRELQQENQSLKKENKKLKENAENNDKVVDKVNWENQLLKKEKKQLKEEYNKIQKAYESTFSDYQQLKDNWNMLKEHLTNRYNNGTESISYRQVFIEIREAMQVLEIQQELEQRRQELEQGSDSNE